MSEPKAAAGDNLGALIPVLGLCGFASTFTMRLIDPLVPTLAAEFGQSVHQIAFLVTAFSGCYALGQLVDTVALPPQPPVVQAWAVLTGMRQGR